MKYRSVLDERSDVVLTSTDPPLPGTSIRLEWGTVLRLLESEPWRMPPELVRSHMAGAVAVVLAIAQLWLWAEDRDRAKWFPEPESTWEESAYP